MRLWGLCNWKKIGLFYHEVIYLTPGLLTPDGMHPSQRGKRVLAQELERLVDRDLIAWKGTNPGLPVMNNEMMQQNLRKQALSGSFQQLQEVLATMQHT